jgi:membrane protein
MPEMMTCQGGAGQARPMSLEGLSGLVNRIIAWADRLQREHDLLGFLYAVVKKYGDDEGGRQAALITYYGFLSIFPLLLLGVAVLSRVLADHPDLRRRLIDEIVPRALRSSVEHSLATMPTSTVPFVVGLVGLLLSGTGVMFSAYQTLNHVAAVRHRLRAGFFSRYVRVFVVLAILMLGALAAGALTVVATALPGQPAVQRAAAVLGTALVVFAVLLLGAKLLLARPAPVRALWPGAVLGAAAVTVVLTAGAPLLARLVAKAGPVYGSFATVAGMFALLYLVGQALVYAAEVAAVRYARLWPRALDLNRPTAAEVRALTLLAREQERIPAARVDFHLAAPVPSGSAPPDDGPGNPAIQLQAPAASTPKRALPASARDRKRSIQGFCGHDHPGLGMHESPPCPLIKCGCALRQLIALGPPHRVQIEPEVPGNLLQRRPAVKLTGNGLGGDAADCRHAEADQRVDPDRRGRVLMRAPASRLVARPVHPLEELLSRRGQDRLPVRDRDQAELRNKVTTVLQVDQQPPARADIRAPVGQRVRHLELLAEPVDELPQLLQRHIMLTPVRPQQAGLDEFRPRDAAGPSRLDPDHRTVARRAALQPPVQRRRCHPQ